MNKAFLVFLAPSEGEKPTKTMMMRNGRDDGCLEVNNEQYPSAHHHYGSYTFANDLKCPLEAAFHDTRHAINANRPHLMSFVRHFRVSLLLIVLEVMMMKQMTIIYNYTLTTAIRQY